MYDGTITSTLKPIVTMLTEALVKDFMPAYRAVGEGIWARTDETGFEVFVTERQLQGDVHNWLLGLENAMENESDLAFAKMTAHMIQKNPGWTVLLTNRLKRRLGERE